MFQDVPESSMFLVLSTAPSHYVFPVVPLDCFAVIDPESSGSLTNSVAASVFPSGEQLKRPKNCCHLCFLDFIPVDRAEISHMNRPQNSSQLPSSYQKSP